jgi:hypothetical protein
MRRAVVLFLAILGAAAAADDAMDRVEEALAWNSADGRARGRLSGLVDLEQYSLPRPAPGVIESESRDLFNPRLSVFLDAQLGDEIYAFAQARLDRGFDPSTDRLRGRLDEYALRWRAVGDGLLDIQVGKFGTIVGNWVPRHDSWQNAFITAPLPYENLTGVWDNAPARSGDQLLVWSHVRPGLPANVVEEEKYWQLPIIWGPSYAAGVALAGSAGRFRYAAEVKNASLASRPDAWSPRESGLAHPTVSGRLRYVPSQEWEVGVSMSSGSFLRPVAGPQLDPSIGRSEYREHVIGADVAYAWHHFQFWAEVYAARFTMPRVGDAETTAYYLEAKYKITPAFSAAVRWGQQFFGTIESSTGPERWGHDTWRFDVAPTMRLTAHAQVKLQGSVFRSNELVPRTATMVAAQVTLRF